jgi:prepilin-type N-terminal cleavage/methylation domain-containing protein
MNKRSGVTLIEMLFTTALLAIFAVFVMEYLTTAWFASEKTFNRSKCIVAGENIIETVNALGIADQTSASDEEAMILAYRKVFSNEFDSPATIDVATWTTIKKDSFAHPDGYTAILSRIATETGQICSYTLYIADANLANQIEIKTSFTKDAISIDYGI